MSRWNRSRQVVELKAWRLEDGLVLLNHSVQFVACAFGLPWFVNSVHAAPRRQIWSWPLRRQVVETKLERPESCLNLFVFIIFSQQNQVALRDRSGFPCYFTVKTIGFPFCFGMWLQRIWKGRESTREMPQAEPSWWIGHAECLAWLRTWFEYDFLLHDFLQDVMNLNDLL